MTTATHPVTGSGRQALKKAWHVERAAARAARDRGDSAGEWHHLERAHILSQPFPVPHVRVHVAMFGFAWRHGWWGEVIGQIPRVILAGPASALGRAPIGNTGGSNVSLFKPLPVPADRDMRPRPTVPCCRSSSCGLGIRWVAPWSRRRHMAASPAFERAG